MACTADTGTFSAVVSLNVLANLSRTNYERTIGFVGGATYDYDEIYGSS